jgi:ribosomal protein S27E
VTRETKTTISPSDIKAVEIECTKCHNRIVRPAGGIWQLDIMNCPGCGSTWIPYREAMGRLRDVIFQLHGFSDLPSQGTGVPFTIRLEIREEDKP